MINGLVRSKYAPNMESPSYVALIWVAVLALLLVSCDSSGEELDTTSSVESQTTILHGQINSALHDCLRDSSCNGEFALHEPFMGWERNKSWKVFAPEDLRFVVEDVLIYLQETLDVSLQIVPTNEDVSLSYHPEIPTSMRRCGTDSIATHDANWAGCTSISVVDYEVISAQIVLWSDDPGTILHELLHALFFVHGHVSSRPSIMNLESGMREMTALDIELAKFYLRDDAQPGRTLSEILAEYSAVDGPPIADAPPPSELNVTRLELSRRIADLAAHRRSTNSNHSTCTVKEDLWADWEGQYPDITIGTIGRSDSIHLAEEYLNGFEAVLLDIEVACHEEIENRAAMQAAVADLEVRVSAVRSNFAGFCTVPSDINLGNIIYSASTYASTTTLLTALDEQLAELEVSCHKALEEHLRSRIKEFEPALRELKLSYPDLCGTTFAREFPNFSEDYELPNLEEFLVGMPIWEIGDELTALGDRLERMYYSCHVDRHAARLAQLRNAVQPWATGHYCDIRGSLQNQFPGISDIFSINGWTSLHTIRELEAVLGDAERQVNQMIAECRSAKEEAANSQIQSLKKLSDAIQKQVAPQCSLEFHFQRLGGEMHTILYGTPSLSLILGATSGHTVDTYPTFQMARSELEHLRELCSQLPIAQSWIALNMETPTSVSEFYIQEGKILSYSFEGLEFNPPPICEGQMDLVEDRDWSLEYAVYHDQTKEVYVPAGSVLCVNWYESKSAELWFDDGQESYELSQSEEPIGIAGLDEGTYKFTVGTDYYRVAVVQHTAQIGFRVYVGTPKQLDANAALALVLRDPQGNQRHLPMPSGEYYAPQSGSYSLSIELSRKALEYQWGATIGSLELSSASHE